METKYGRIYIPFFYRLLGILEPGLTGKTARNCFYGLGNGSSASSELFYGQGAIASKGAIVNNRGQDPSVSTLQLLFTSNLFLFGKFIWQSLSAKLSDGRSFLIFGRGRGLEDVIIRRCDCLANDCLGRSYNPGRRSARRGDPGRVEWCMTRARGQEYALRSDAKTRRGSLAWAS